MERAEREGLGRVDKRRGERGQRRGVILPIDRPPRTQRAVEADERGRGVECGEARGRVMANGVASTVFGSASSWPMRAYAASTPTTSPGSPV
jgi:hypothetical protein